MCDIDWNLMLEFTKVILSAPPMAAFIAALIVLLFRKDIAAKLRALIKAPGTEFAPPQPDPPTPTTVNEPAKFEITGEAKSGQAQITNIVGTISHNSIQTIEIDESRIPDILKNDPVAIEEIKSAIDDPYRYVAEFKRISMSLNYERIFQWIYGSQIRLLQFLAFIDDTAPLTTLRNYYRDHASLTTTDHTMSDYIDFLKKWGLIVEYQSGISKVYRITEYGRDFLGYIASQYPDTWNKKPH